MKLVSQLSCNETEIWEKSVTVFWSWFPNFLLLKQKFEINRLDFNEQKISQKSETVFYEVGFPTFFQQTRNLRKKCDRILKLVFQPTFDEQEIWEKSVTIFWSWFPTLLSTN